MIYTLTHLITGIVGLIIAFVIIGVPTGIILKRLGYSEWWSLVIFIPGGALVGLWVLAYANWPGPKMGGK
jgi:ABC-type proline/glycine betaine transport system permease subunit